jgi:hypothetical protein
VTSIDAWQQAIDVDGFPLKLSAAIPFADLHGALPALLADRRTAFECDHRDSAEVIADYPEIDFGHRWTYALAFRWGADVDAGVSAYAAAAAYAAATNGVIMDFQEGRIISRQRAIDVAHDLDRSRLAIELAVRHALEKSRK